MLISPVLLILLAVLLIFVIMVVPTALYIKQQAVRGDVDLCLHKIARVELEMVETLTSISQINQLTTDIKSQQEVAKARDLATQESLRSLGNKWNSRARVEEKRAAKPEKEEEDEEVDLSKIGIPLFPQQPQQEKTQPAKRAFGSRP
jgi:hypothetical protein